MKKNKKQGVAMQTGTIPSRDGNPEAFIASKKNRLPVYSDGQVFLRDGQEFELELFNPTQKPIGIQISINGQQMSSSMLVLRPGMRYFLDRFLDEAKKLAFETYQADNTPAGKAATAKNGLVEIRFHREKEPTPYIAPLHTPTVFTFPQQQDQWTIPGNLNPWQYTTGTPVYGQPSTINISETSSGSPLRGGAVNQFFCSTTSTTLDSFPVFNETENVASANTFETGRIEKGGNSSQSFSNYDGDFESFAFHTVSWKIQPESIKAEAMRSYCACGKRLKDNFKFCPSCGNPC